MDKDRDAGAREVCLRKVDVGDHDAGLGASLCQNLAPGRDDERVPIGLAAGFMFSALRGGEHETARFDGARAAARASAPAPWAR